MILIYLPFIIVTDAVIYELPDANMLLKSEIRLIII